MPTASFVVSLYTYPWDLADEGLGVSLDRIADLAACDEVLLTPCYHRSEYYLPHNPRRPVYFGENGAVCFSPDLSRYEGTRMRPRVSREVTDPAWFDRMVEAVVKRGIGFSAWIVYTFQNHLSEHYPEFARHDPFGTPGGRCFCGPGGICGRRSRSGSSWRSPARPAPVASPSTTTDC